MTEVFIVRIWPEPRDINQKPALRGTVEHIDSDRKYYFQNLQELMLHLIPHLEEMNVEFDKRWRILFWFKKQRDAFYQTNDISDDEANHNITNECEK